MRRLNKTFGERIADLKTTYQSRGKTVQDLADSLDVSRSTIYNYEKLTDPPNSKTADRVMDLLPRRERYEYRERPRAEYEKRKNEGFPDAPSPVDFAPRTEHFPAAWAQYIEQRQPREFVNYIEGGGKLVVDMVAWDSEDDVRVFDFREAKPPGEEIVDEITFTFSGYDDLNDFLNDYWQMYNEFYGRQ